MANISKTNRRSIRSDSLPMGNCKIIPTKMTDAINKETSAVSPVFCIMIKGSKPYTAHKSKPEQNDPNTPEADAFKRSFRLKEEGSLNSGLCDLVRLSGITANEDNIAVKANSVSVLGSLKFIMNCPSACAAYKLIMYNAKICPLISILPAESNQLSMTINTPAVAKPPKNLSNNQNHVLKKIPCKMDITDNKEAKAANALI